MHTIQGHVEGPYWRVARSLEQQVRKTGGGAAVCVYHRGRKVVDMWGGYKDEGGNPWVENTMAMSFSTSKGVISTLVHLLADRGELKYDDPISRYWPEFGRNGKHEITIRQALTHRAGLARLRPLVEHPEQILDWGFMVRALEDAEAYRGRRSAYHAMTYGWLVGELIQRVTGSKLPEVIQKELVEPLDLDGLYIGAPEAAQRRAASLGRRPGQDNSKVASAILSDTTFGALGSWARLTGMPFNPKLMFQSLVLPGNSDVLWSPEILGVPVPAVNGLFTARSLARMYAMFAGEGEVDGIRLLSPETVWRAAEVQVHSRDKVIPMRMQWRLGYHAAFTTRGTLSSAFGHFGFGGSGGWADPERGLAVAMVNNQLGGSPFGDMRIARVSTAAVSAVDSLEGRRFGAVMEPSSLEPIAE
jgi:CubicO group peptidase (beta-lactamase class C family)